LPPAYSLPIAAKVTLYPSFSVAVIVTSSPGWMTDFRSMIMMWRLFGSRLVVLFAGILMPPTAGPITMASPFMVIWCSSVWSVRVLTAETMVRSLSVWLLNMPNTVVIDGSGMPLVARTHGSATVTSAPVDGAAGDAVEAEPASAPGSEPHAAASAAIAHASSRVRGATQPGRATIFISLGPAAGRRGSATPRNRFGGCRPRV
jgi:hypothetical protein